MKGKPGFRAHIPLGVRHLRELLAAWRILPGEAPLEEMERVVSRLETP